MPEQNNTFQKNRVSTSGITLFDENGIMLKLSYLDDSFSLVLGEPRVADNGKRSYPEDLRHPFILTLDRAQALYENIILRKVLPAIESGEDYNGGVFLNKRKDSIFEVHLQSGDLYLVYYKDIGEDRTPGSTLAFKCQKTQIIESYHPDGTSFEQSSIEAYFMVFVKYLESGIFDMFNSSTHAYRKANYFTTNRIFTLLESICTKLGISIENRSYGNRSNTGFDEQLPFSDDIPSAYPAGPAQTSLEGLLS